MRVHVLGSAAGGGFPQWNCNCRNCDGVRRGTLNAKRRTQSSIALSADGAGWLLCNASPDILQQLQQFPALQPARALRDTAINGVLLIDAQIDHATGLYMLREHRQKLPLWCTTPVFDDLTRGNPILELLKHYCGVDRHEIPLDARPFAMPAMPGLQFTAIPLISNAPPYSPHRDDPVPGDNIGLLVRSLDSGRSLFYAPGLGRMEPPVWSAMRSADVVLVDGTCWRDDELVALGASKKTARDMGHLPQTGAGGMLQWLGELPAGARRILIHINNTNPILDEDGAEYAQLRAAGVEVAYDGMEIEL
ncbi:pyrroloquinoline quinone biosynthesis protein PqqB [Hydrocarboniphaga sp.]|uniref:pyrroloquinoline quinone biosynthesis protein PqqB n=1 Tax=Hydrocarboniphaga sp. TaxID=2033016 RepID=UPI003D0A0155